MVPRRFQDSHSDLTLNGLSERIGHGFDPIKLHPTSMQIMMAISIVDSGGSRLVVMVSRRSLPLGWAA